MLATGSDAFTAERRKALLRCLGEEGQRIYETLHPGSVCCGICGVPHLRAPCGTGGEGARAGPGTAGAWTGSQSAYERGSDGGLSSPGICGVETRAVCDHGDQSCVRLQRPELCVITETRAVCDYRDQSCVRLQRPELCAITVRN